MAGLTTRERGRGLLSGDGDCTDKFRRVPGTKTRITAEYGKSIGQREREAILGVRGVGADGGVEKRESTEPVSHQAITPSTPSIVVPSTAAPSTTTPSSPLAKNHPQEEPRTSQPVELLDIRQTFALSSMIPPCPPETIRERSLSPKKRADAAKIREAYGAPPYDFTEIDCKKAASISSRWQEWANVSGGVECAKALHRGMKRMIREVERNLEWIRKHDKKRRDDERYEKTGQYTSKRPLKQIDPTREIRLLGEQSAAREVARLASRSVRFCCTFGSAENAIEHYRKLAQKHQELSRDPLITIAGREHHSGVSSGFFGVVRILSLWRQAKIKVAKCRESRVKAVELDGDGDVGKVSCKAETFGSVEVRWSEKGVEFVGAAVIDSRGDKFVWSGANVLVMTRERVGGLVVGGELRWVSHRRLRGIVAAENALKLRLGVLKTREVKGVSKSEKNKKK